MDCRWLYIDIILIHMLGDACDNTCADCHYEDLCGNSQFPGGCQWDTSSDLWCSPIEPGVTPPHHTTLRWITYHMQCHSTIGTCGGVQHHGTPEGAPCQFPFSYGGVTHTTCTTMDHTEPWCLTDPVADQASHLQDGTASWGNCNCGMHIC